MAKTNTYEIKAWHRRSRREVTEVFEGSSQELQTKAQAMGNDGYKNVRFRRVSRREMTEAAVQQACA